MALNARYLADKSALARYHYDAAFERVGAVGGAEQVWVAPRGSHRGALRPSDLEPERRFELLTCALRVRCSTD